MNEPLGPFLCNICGTRNISPADPRDRERVTCSRCHSSMRFRSVILALSRALFGLDLILPDFPVLKSVRGLGLSDSDVYSEALESRFSYLNTFYHRDPGFDLPNPDEREFGKYDFVICSEVLEHVPAPVDRTFATLAQFHGGTGSTLERRVFSEQSIREGLAAASLPLVHFDARGNRDFGIAFADPAHCPSSRCEVRSH